MTNTLKHVSAVPPPPAAQTPSPGHQPPNLTRPLRNTGIAFPAFPGCFQPELLQACHPVCFHPVFLSSCHQLNLLALE